MECNKFVLEKLEGGDTPEFSAHRLGCPGCTRDVEELIDVRRLYHEATEEERWKGGVPLLRRRPPSAWLALSAAAALAVAVLAGLWRRPAAEVEPTSSAPAPFFRISLAPWDREENRLARAMDDAWGRLEKLEGGVR